MNRTMLSIMKVLEDCPKEVLGSSEICRKLNEYGIELTERTVRYHMRILDERGYTRCVGKKGRMLTHNGSEELCKAQVTSKLGFIISKIENLSCQTDINLQKAEGKVILNVTFIPQERLKEALEIMRPVFLSSFCVSNKVLVLKPGEQLGSVKTPNGMAGIGTVCSVTINGIFLKAGVPVTSIYGGVLEIADYSPTRFTCLISYAGTSLDPLEIFIKSRMTSMGGALKHGRGAILASFREIPAAAIDTAAEINASMKKIGLGGILKLGKPNSELFEVPVGYGRMGMVVAGGLNPVAALEEEGIHTVSSAMSAMFDYKRLVRFEELI